MENSEALPSAASNQVLFQKPPDSKPSGFSEHDVEEVHRSGDFSEEEFNRRQRQYLVAPP